MKSLRFGLVLMLLISLLGFGAAFAAKASAAPPDPFDPEQFGVPHRVGNREILAVLTDANYGCLSEPKQLLIQSTAQTPQDAMREAADINTSLVANRLDEFVGRWQIVGPGISRADAVDELNRTHQFHKTNGCNMKLGMPPALKTAAKESGCVAGGSQSGGFAVVQDTDAGLYADAKAQAVYLTAPTVGNRQINGGYSAFLSNVWTNKNYFIQVGFVFGGGEGFLVWTDSLPKVDCSPQELKPLKYVAGHAYWTTLTFLGGWWQCAYDTYVGVSSYVCNLDTPQYNPAFASPDNPNGDTGDHLSLSYNTSVWVENHNVSAAWWKGFSPTWVASGATIVPDASGYSYSWISQNEVVASCKPWLWPSSHTMSGSLINGQAVYWNIQAAPLGCVQK